MEHEMNQYVYEGPIMVFDRCVQGKWRAETMAVSKRKAMSNITYQAKKLCNLVADTRVTLPGNLYLMKGGVD